VPLRERVRLARVDFKREIIQDYSHPPSHLRIAMLEAHPTPGTQVTVTPAEFAAMWTELGKVELRIRTKLVDDYLSSLG
jgi:hypothetical protein